MNLIFSVIFSWMNAFSFAQSPVDWEISIDSGNEIVLFKATISEGWHIYSQTVSEDAGPVPTQIVFDPNNSLKFKGKTKEPKGKFVFDENFASKLKTFEDEVTFTQKIAWNGNATMKGTITYMACNNEGCIPPVTLPFELVINENQTK